MQKSIPLKLNCNPMDQDQLNKEILKDVIELEAAYQVLMEEGRKFKSLCHKIRMKAAGVSTTDAPPNILPDSEIAKLKGGRRKSILRNQSKL